MSSFYEDYLNEFGEYFDIDLLPKIKFVLSQLQTLIGNYFEARNKYLGLNESKYSFEQITEINNDSFEVKFSHDYGCRCSSRCNYDYTYVNIPFSALFYTDEEMREYFRPQKEEQDRKLEEERLKQLEKEELKKQEKELEEKELLAKLKAKYE